MSQRTSLKFVRHELRAMGMEIVRTEMGEEFRVNFKNGREASAYYTDDLHDALETARDMYARTAGKRAKEETAQRLNKAAPDMFKALQTIAEWPANRNSDADVIGDAIEDIQSLARAAIAKARGL